ncbi:FecR family protein [Sphingobacterium haloxyli]|uniref:FecR protein domain-containing protein n=1 Tax=Sphingobacterium haloxyli TaxID=2100533 RepID=A0A2S9J826_9SPHI|nr:FecR family protein [Sphingobacterium haloxyli]PRD48943.1 hypothetical protein C5745_03120 [Sphingobacterium haloxyli]
MKFGRKRGGKGRKSEAKQQARRKIWEDPVVVEEIFNDVEWGKYDGTTKAEIPSQKMAQNIDEGILHEKIRIRKREHHLRRSNRIVQLGIAASLLLFISFHFWEASLPSDMPVFVQRDSTSSPQWVVITNESIPVDTIHLSDRSTVHLYKKSSIRYLADFSDSAREVHLEGKAFFDVEKDAKRPFSVFAGETKTTALGTSFTIDTYIEDRHTNVVLHTGKVMVASTTGIPAFESVLLDRKGANLLFDANMRIVQHRKGDKPEVEKSTQTETVETNKNLLSLDNIPLRDVFVKLQEVYQTTIRIRDNSINDILYTGIVDPQHEAIHNVLTVICLINDLRFEEEPDGSYNIYRQDEEKHTHKNDNP